LSQGRPPQPVLRGEHEAAAGGEALGADRLGLGREGLAVLGVAVGHLADRRHAEGHEIGLAARRLALEAARQGAVEEGLGQPVAGPGEVVHAEEGDELGDLQDVGDPRRPVQELEPTAPVGGGG
jgi:hypothetical protein